MIKLKDILDEDCPAGWIRGRKLLVKESISTTLKVKK